MSDRKIVDYILLWSPYHKLDDDVSAWIKKGYQPFGAPFIRQNDEYDHIFQAMVKYEKKIELDFCESCDHLVAAWEAADNCKCECHTGE